jgi:hypothetical protein
MTGPQPHHQLWTPADDDKLRAMFEAGMKAEQIARKLKRTVTAVSSRAKKLRRIRGAGGLKAKGK